jgi:hypothetical protein
MMSPAGVKRYTVEYAEKWREICAQVPFIKFDPRWEISVIPPFAGAVARFLVRDPAIPKSKVSVYLDWFDALGYMDAPYWEVYPVGDDTERCLLAETEKLLESIRKSLVE